ncbi:MAG: hypothetical protein M1549_00470 [Candidatus Dependentiae bacterium]|nr:hypothetical protein [Candidatus Dependentiae bacterium]
MKRVVQRAVLFLVFFGLQIPAPVGCVSPLAVLAKGLRIGASGLSGLMALNFTARAVQSLQEGVRWYNCYHKEFCKLYRSAVQDDSQKPDLRSAERQYREGKSIFVACAEWALVYAIFAAYAARFGLKVLRG